MDNNKFYLRFLVKFGTSTPDARAQALAWENEEKHLARFEVVTNQLGDEGSLMDVGCGLGDLAAYLKERKPKIEYNGIDTVPLFVKYCEKIGLNARIKNLFQLPQNPAEYYDYIACIGTFNVIYNMEYGVQSLLRLARKKLIVNGLHSTYSKKDKLQVFNPEKIRDSVKGWDKSGIIHDERLPIDFFLVFEKEAVK